jgi:polygalacturonase
VLAARQVAGRLNQQIFDTSRLQSAIDACPVGQAVELADDGVNNAFLTQPLTLKAGVTLLVDADVTLFGSGNKADYQCSRSKNRCTPLIAVAGNTAPNPGSAIMGYGVIDGQGAGWWCDGCDPRPGLVELGFPRNSDGFVAYKITLQNAPIYTLYGHGDDVTIWDVKISNPNNSPNTDGIDPSASADWTITRSYISDGDDQIALKAGDGPVSNITISANHFYSGHGVSIGSETKEGVNNVLVTDNVIDQTGCPACSSGNDVRIKADVSSGGVVQNVLYQNLCIRNGSAQPHEIVFDPVYDPAATGNGIPFFHDIHLRNVHMVDAGDYSTLAGFDAQHPLTLTLDNVVFDEFNPRDFTNARDAKGAFTRNARVTLGPGPVSFAAALRAATTADPSVTVVDQIANHDPPYDCAGKFTSLAGELTGAAGPIAAGQPEILTAIVQTIVNPATPPTGIISILDNGQPVASAPYAGRITRLTIPNVSAGHHHYTARYSGDPVYAPFTFGSFSTTAN